MPISVAPQALRAYAVVMLIVYRNMSRIYTARTLADALAVGHASAVTFGAFDVHTLGGAVLWSWESR